MKKTGAVLIIVLIIGVGVGAYFLFSGKGVDSEVLSGLDKDILCYDSLEDIAILLDDSCSDETFEKVFDVISEADIKSKSYTEEQREECLETIANYGFLLNESCGEDAFNRFGDVIVGNIKSDLEDGRSCLDKQAMGLPCD